ncbi:hypothetical protein CVT24_005000 [Panaeolus cyanescens]|uniref:F-box domain-containing protein n=1 Tax=Panaeolus cyanescens TaxID=181874 RepID=A0A409V9Q3_9AGAR|nr:hypothetical protein CVT24_005000 [Panaeolus cyanescens]
MYNNSNSTFHTVPGHVVGKGKQPASSGSSFTSDVANSVAERANSQPSFPAWNINRAMRQAKMKGKLSRLMDMPVDILFEVFGLLHPTDLLNLSRTSKSYRAFLTARASANLWRVSFRNVEGAPDPFEDMSFPAWAYLLFVDRCHFCDVGHSKIDWTFKLRACTMCAHEILNVTHTEVPTSVHPRSVAARVFRDKIHINLCQEWDSNRAVITPKSLKADRISTIKSKLRELGWGDDALNYVERSVALQNVVSKPEKLTDEDWEDIGPFITNHLNDRVRQGMSFNLRVKAPMAVHKPWEEDRKILAAQFWKEYKSVYYPSRMDLPSGLEFVSMKPVADIVGCPRNVAVTPESFHHLMPILPGLLEEWCQKWRKYSYQ